MESSAFSDVACGVWRAIVGTAAATRNPLLITLSSASIGSNLARFVEVRTE